MIDRRTFVALATSGAVVTPGRAHAQRSTMPVIGYLSPHPKAGIGSSAFDAFRRGVAEGGYVDGRDVSIVYLASDGHHDRLPGLAADLVARKVEVIVASGSTATSATRAATSTIPIVFSIGTDPVETGIVGSLARPGGNLTGSARLNVAVAQKRLELLREAVPGARQFALLINPNNPTISAPISAESESAARTLGIDLRILEARNDDDIARAFTTIADWKTGALVIGTDAFFSSRISELGALTVRHKVPTMYNYREFATAGGLLAYGIDFAETHRIAGVYAARILKGEKPADLPVQQSSNVAFYVNLTSMRALGLTVPPAILMRADEVIE